MERRDEKRREEKRREEDEEKRERKGEDEDSVPQAAQEGSIKKQETNTCIHAS